MARTSAWRKNALPLIRRILGIFGMNRDFVRSSSTQTEESVCVNIPEDYNSWNATEIALLEAERKKAEALTRRRFIF